MKLLKLLMFLGFLFRAGSAIAAPVVGGSEVYRSDGTHSYPAVVLRVTSATRVDLLVVGTDWLWYQDGVTYTTQGTPVLYVADVDRGTGDGQWLENPALYVGSRVTALSTPTLTMGGAAVQFSATNDSNYRATITVAPSITLSAGAAAHVDLLCDATATPSVVVDTVGNGNTGTLVVGANLNQTVTQSLNWRVPAGQRCRLALTNDVGTPVTTIVRQLLQTLD